MSELIARLDRIFEGLFGVRMEYIAAGDLQSSEWDAAGLEGYLSQTMAPLPFIRDVSEKRIGLPIRTGGKFAGLAVIAIGGQFDIQRMLELADLAIAMLERELDKSNGAIEILRQTEEHLILQQGHDNVVPLRPVRRPATAMRDDFEIFREQEEVSPLRSILISSTSGFPFQQVAFAIHSQAARWAFLSIKDLPSDAFESMDGFRKLGAITLFIDDLACVPLDRQKKLLEYISLEPSADAPLIIAAITEDAEQLIAAGLLLADLQANLLLLRFSWNPQDTDAATVRKSMRIFNNGRPVSVDSRFVPFHADFLDPDHPTMH